MTLKESYIHLFKSKIGKFPVGYVCAVFIALLVANVVISVAWEHAKPSILKTTKFWVGKEHIEDFMAARGIKSVKEVTPLSRRLLSEKWITSTLVPEYRKFLVDNKLTIYDPKTNNCTHFSSNMVAVCNALLKKKTGDDHGTVGLYVYNSNLLDFHMIHVVIVLIRDEEFELMFIEPQTGGRVIFAPDMLEDTLYYGFK